MVNQTIYNQTKPFISARPIPGLQWSVLISAIQEINYSKKKKGDSLIGLKKKFKCILSRLSSF